MSTLANTEEETPAEYVARRTRAWDEYVAHIDEEDQKVQELHKFHPYVVRTIFNAGFDLSDEGQDA